MSSLLASTLHADETVLWSARAVPSKIITMKLLYGLFGGGICLFMINELPSNLNDPAAVLFSLLMLAVGGFLISLPIRTYRKATNLHYFITNQRVLFIIAAEKAEIRAFEPYQIDDFNRVDYANGTSDLYLRKQDPRLKATGLRDPGLYNGFWGIPDGDGATAALEALSPPNFHREYGVDGVVYHGSDNTGHVPTTSHKDQSGEAADKNTWDDVPPSRWPWPTEQPEEKPGEAENRPQTEGPWATARVSKPDPPPQAEARETVYWSGKPALFLSCRSLLPWFFLTFMIGATAYFFGFDLLAAAENQTGKTVGIIEVLIGIGFYGLILISQIFGILRRLRLAAITNYKITDKRIIIEIGGLRPRTVTILPRDLIDYKRTDWTQNSADFRFRQTQLLGENARLITKFQDGFWAVSPSDLVEDSIKRLCAGKKPLKEIDGEGLWH